MQNHNFKEGQAYYIKAYDHAAGTKEIIVVEVVGWVLTQTDIAVTMAWWVTQSKDKDVREDNVEPFVILKSAIIKKTPLTKLPKALL
jgi:hypothetical protein